MSKADVETRLKLTSLEWIAMDIFYPFISAVLDRAGRLSNAMRFDVAGRAQIPPD